MKIGNYTIAASAVALGLATLITPSSVQGQPLYDRVNVTLPYSVTLGSMVLQPGSYVIQQQRSFSGDSNVLLIYGEDGRKFETSAVTIPAFENQTQNNTRVILHHVGNDYYFDRVWIEGKEYGYEFPLPDNVKAREKELMQPVYVAAQYSAMKQQPAPQPAPPPEPVPETPPPPPEQPPAVTPEPEPAPPAATPPVTMPKTSAGWLMMLLSGGVLSGAGLALRRKG